MARPEQEVAKELERFGCLLSHDRVSAIASELSPGESIVDALAKKDGWFQQLDTCVVVTSRQIMTDMEKNRFHRIYWQDVAKIETQAGSGDIYPSLRVQGYGNSSLTAYFTDKFMKSEQFRAFYSDLFERLTNHKSPAAPSGRAGQTAAPSSDSLIDKLERLAELRERGHISKEEFEQAKRKLLQGS